ncbi:hypothetical protein [Gracilimonas sp.]|uniref:hypothetical protein n=1 Tax=Gracilimonas sp. TaxID=1974203 RepID=UPI0028729185|nr:hypothetical protein [Gracilimonas sp.]
MDNQNIKHLILDSILTLSLNHKYLGQTIMLEKSSIVLAKHENIYSQIRKDYRNQFRGYDIKDLNNDTFNNLKTTFKEMIRERKSSLFLDFITYDSFGECYEYKHEFGKNLLMDEILKEVIRREPKSTENNILLQKMNDSKRREYLDSLLELSEPIIRLEIISEVERSLASFGKYEAKIDFFSVADACRYYIENYEIKISELDKPNMRKIKEWVREYAVIYDKGKILNKWSIINARINSWKQNP